MKYRALLCSAGLFLLTAQTQADALIPALHSLSVQQDNIVFEVTSHGCSQNADFKLRVEDGPRITLLRSRPDFCKRMPKVFRVVKSLSAAGLSLQTPFAINNPFTPPPTKGRGIPGRSPAKAIPAGQ